MADDTTRNSTKAAAATYRAELVAAGGAQERASSEQAQARQLENAASGLRQEARADTQVARRAPRL